MSVDFSFYLHSFCSFYLKDLITIQVLVANGVLKTKHDKKINRNYWLKDFMRNKKK